MSTFVEASLLFYWTLDFVFIFLVFDSLTATKEHFLWGGDNVSHTVDVIPFRSPACPPRSADSGCSVCN